MKTSKNFFSVIILTVATDLTAAAWSHVAFPNDIGQYQFDPFSVVGPGNDRKIIVKVNFLKERPDKFRSMLVHYSVDCGGNTILRELMRGYANPDLAGVATDIPGVNLLKREEIKPNSIFKKYAEIVCGNTGLANSAQDKETSATGPQKQDSRIVRLNYFSKINSEKNLEEAFSGVMTEDQRFNIAWHFIFANNLLWKLTQAAQSFDSYLAMFSQVLPAMTEGVSKYNELFDTMSTSLGVPKGSLLRQFGIEVSARGTADFAPSMNSRIEGQMNLYIWYYGQASMQCSWLDLQCQKEERGRQLERAEIRKNLDPYYLQRPPAVLYGPTLAEDLKKVENFYQKALGNALRIDAQLAAQESNRLARESIYGDKQLRDFLSRNWPHWDEKTIDHAVSSEIAIIRRNNPNFNNAEVNQAVRALWEQRANQKNNPALRPDAKTVAARRGFTGPLATIDNEAELSGACVAVARSFIENARGTRFDVRGIGQWASCLGQRNMRDSTFRSGVNRWSSEFSNTNPGTLQILMDQCTNNIVVTWSNATGQCLQ